MLAELSVLLYHDCIHLFSLQTDNFLPRKILKIVAFLKQYFSWDFIAVKAIAEQKSFSFICFWENSGHNSCVLEIFPRLRWLENVNLLTEQKCLWFVMMVVCNILTMFRLFHTLTHLFHVKHWTVETRKNVTKCHHFHFRDS